VKLNYRSFPYPVMTGWTDDIAEHDFNILYGEMRFDKFYYYLPYTVSIGNCAIASLIESGDAGFALHVECRGTFYRQLHWLESQEDILSLSADELEGRVEVNIIVCAKKIITGYQPDGLHEDYTGIPLILNPGDYLAIGQPVQFDANKNFDPIEKISSIIAFAPDEERDDGEIIVDISGDKLLALVPKKLHEKYDLLKQSLGAEAPAVLSSLLVLPVLMEGCRYISDIMSGKGEPGEDHTDLRWARVLETRCRRLGIDLANEDSIVVAQKILANPYSRTCNELKMLYERGA
jgi:hypothetical protein